MDLTFNTKPRPPLRVNPKTLVIIGQHKIRKTLTLSKLPQSLIIETDPGGGDYIEGAFFDFHEEYRKAVTSGEFKGDGSSPSLLEFLEKQVIPELKKKRPAKRLVIDTIDEVEDWILADINKRKTVLLLTGKDNSGPLDSVIELKYGGGQALIAERFTSLWAQLVQCAEELVFVCHIKRNFDPNDPGGAKKDISSDIDLRGQVRKVPCKLGAAICTLTQSKPSTLVTELWANFQSGADTAGGTRLLRLDGMKKLLSKCVFAGAKDASGNVLPKIDPVTKEPIVESFTCFWNSVYLPDGEAKPPTPS